MGAHLFKALLAAGTLSAIVAGPAHADITRVGPDLEGKTATLAEGDPNDIVYWGAEPGLAVPVQGEVRAVSIVGGTQQTAAQLENARKQGESNQAVRDYDILHFVVLRKADDGNYRSVVTSNDLRAPVVGQGGTTASTVTRLPLSDGGRVCVRPGDRIAMATVGGYVPPSVPGRTADGFEDGLQYQTFARNPGNAVNVFSTSKTASPGTINENQTIFSPVDSLQDHELLMQAEVGTGGDARFFCQTAEEQKGASGGGSGGGPAKPLVPMATPLLKTRRLSKKGTVPVNLTCRATGTDCAGTITLRAHKKTIAKAKYKLAKGASKVFTVKLTTLGRRYVRVASAKKLRTAVVVTSTGGRTGQGIFNIRPVKK